MITQDCPSRPPFTEPMSSINLIKLIGELNNGVSYFEEKYTYEKTKL
jgi:hypothetical protein